MSEDSESTFMNIEYENGKIVEKNFLLTPQMKEACKEFVYGDTQIVTVLGAAGTGKSTFMDYVHNEIFDKRHKEESEKGRIYNGGDIVRIAPTGSAAMLIHGDTIHRFFRLPILKNPGVFFPHEKDYYEKLNRGALELWDSASFFIIDEISMVRADILDEIDRRLRAAKENYEEPFGGAKILMLGDPFQLPPVLKDEDKVPFFSIGYVTPFFFSSRVYKDLLAKNKIRQIEFNKIFRQQDEEFLRVLNNVRIGNTSKADLDYINQRYMTEVPHDALHLTTTRKSADSINLEKYNKLEGEERVFKASATGSFVASLNKAFECEDPNTFKDFPAPPVLKLKVGTQIILLVNENNYVNGTLAKITSISDEQIIAEDQEKQYKIQRHFFEEEEYIKTPHGLELMLIGTYTQFPLAYGYALTIHKSQGKTLSQISVTLDNGAFASGQIYVALSRVRTLEGLHLENKIRATDIQADQSVINYFDYCRNHNLL